MGDHRRHVTSLEFSNEKSVGLSPSCTLQRLHCTSRTLEQAWPFVRMLEIVDGYLCCKQLNQRTECLSNFLPNLWSDGWGVPLVSVRPCIRGLAFLIGQTDSIELIYDRTFTHCIERSFNGLQQAVQRMQKLNGCGSYWIFLIPWAKQMPLVLWPSSSPCDVVVIVMAAAFPHRPSILTIVGNQICDREIQGRTSTNPTFKVVKTLSFQSSLSSLFQKERNAGFQLRSWSSDSRWRFRDQHRLSWVSWPIMFSDRLFAC